MKILVVSDDPLPTGYGRISMEVNTRLARRGIEMMAFGLPYDGLLPPRYDSVPLPYWVASGQGKDWVQGVMGVVAAIQPDIIHVIQDAPYAQAVRAAPLDWSRYAFVVTTPVDGAPIYEEWVALLADADAAMTISEFGLNAYRAAGVPVTLCRPGVDGNTFYRLSDAERLALRQRAGIQPEAFVLGTAAQNQGRKAISVMLRAFFRFAQDKPDARYVLDMEPVSPAGWNIPALCRQYGWDASKLLFRQDLARMGLLELRERYALMDAHAVISHREGYGLPLAEAMACGVVSIALDYCSGTEICGGGRGVLVKPIAYTEPGTWGGAEDRFPDMDDFTRKLQGLHDYPHARKAMAERGMAWARAQTWDNAADVVFEAYQRIERRRASIPPAHVPMHAVQPPAPMPVSVDGLSLVEQVTP